LVPGVSFRLPGRKNYGQAGPFEEAKAAFRAEYLYWQEQTREAHGEAQAPEPPNPVREPRRVERPPGFSLDTACFEARQCDGAARGHRRLLTRFSIASSRPWRGQNLFKARLRLFGG
jgi:hypothetical protein